MNISISKVKVCEFASQETTCFECVVLIDGKVVGTAENSGTGGCTFVHFKDPKVRDEVDAYIKSHPPMKFPEFELTVTVTAGFLIDELLESHQAVKHRQKLIRKFTKGMDKGEGYYRLTTQKNGCYYIVKGGLAALGKSIALAAAKNEPVVVFSVSNPNPFIDSLLC